jgi:hypothetical protein
MCINICICTVFLKKYRYDRAVPMNTNLTTGEKTNLSKPTSFSSSWLASTLGSPILPEQMQELLLQSSVRSRSDLKPTPQSTTILSCSLTFFVDGEQRHRPAQAGGCARYEAHNHLHACLYICSQLPRVHGMDSQVLLLGKTSIVVRFAEGLYYECQARISLFDLFLRARACVSSYG